ncbi:MAG: hypothetical protein NVSMB47_11400 [Polyangiales bacterium]
MIGGRHLVFTAVGALLALPCLASACSSGGGGGDDGTDTGADTGPAIPDFDAPILDGAAGQVVVLVPYDPVTRCFDKPTEIGHYDDDAGFSCGTSERCYVRKDGIVYYAAKDCVHGTKFLINVEDRPYTDLGPCEPAKHLDFSTIKGCPNPSCTFARDVTIDTARGCATAIQSRGCRDVVGAPSACFCKGTEVFVSFDGKATSGPAGFTACDATVAACKSALGMVDTVAGCPDPADAGPDAASDAPPTDAPADAPADALDAKGDAADAG